MSGFLFMGMKKVTRLVVQKKNLKRVNVYLDDEYAFALNEYLAIQLSIGQMLSDEKIADLQAADHDESVFLRAVNFIGTRPRSEYEIRKKLRDIGCEESEIEKTVARLKDCDLVNDEQFSSLWVEDRNTFKPSSRRALRYELKQKGVPEEMIQSALENVDEFQTAYEVARKRQSRWDMLDRKDFRKKITAYLAGKGYGFDVIRKVSDQIWDEMHSAGTDSEDEDFGNELY